MPIDAGRDQEEIVTVSCYSGYRYAQEPRSFVSSGQEHRVAKVVRAWQEPSGPAFLVEDEEGQRWQLRYAKAQDIWLCRSSPVPRQPATTS